MTDDINEDEYETIIPYLMADEAAMLNAANSVRGNVFLEFCGRVTGEGQSGPAHWLWDLSRFTKAEYGKLLVTATVVRQRPTGEAITLRWRINENDTTISSNDQPRVMRILRDLVDHGYLRLAAELAGWKSKTPVQEIWDRQWEK